MAAGGLKYASRADRATRREQSPWPDAWRPSRGCRPGAAPERSRTPRPRSGRQLEPSPRSAARRTRRTAAPTGVSPAAQCPGDSTA
nr:hypothetical protein [Streptomyces durhamensis]